MGAGGCAEKGGESDADEGQNGLQLPDQAGEVLIGQDSQDGGHQHDLEGAQRQALHPKDMYGFRW